MKRADADRKQIERLLIAAENYAISVIRRAMATQHVEVHDAAVNDARAALLDEVERIDRDRP